MCGVAASAKSSGEAPLHQTPSRRAAFVFVARASDSKARLVTGLTAAQVATTGKALHIRNRNV